MASGKRQSQVLCFGDESTDMGKPSAAKLLYTMLINLAVGE